MAVGYRDLVIVCEHGIPCQAMTSFEGDAMPHHIHAPYGDSQIYLLGGWPEWRSVIRDRYVRNRY